MTYWKSKQFKELQQEWYQRLEEHGFRDNERLVNGTLELKQFAAKRPRSLDTLRRQAKEIYFNLLSQNIHYAEWKNEVDELILTWYADGKKIKTICEELENRGESRCRNTITFTIRKYEMLWGMRTYTPRQLNQKVK